MGLGPNTRKNAEQCWMALRKGTQRVSRPGGSHTIQQVFTDPIREHSRKPSLTRKFISDLFPAHTKRIELFARKFPDSKYFEGWNIWPAEIEENKEQNRKRRISQIQQF